MAKPERAGCNWGNKGDEERCASLSDPTISRSGGCRGLYHSPSPFVTLDVRLTMFWDFNYAPIDSGEVIQVLGTFAVVPIFENLNKEKPNFPLFFPLFFIFFSFFLFFFSPSSSSSLRPSLAHLPLSLAWIRNLY